MGKKEKIAAIALGIASSFMWFLPFILGMRGYTWHATRLGWTYLVLTLWFILCMGIRISKPRKGGKNDLSGIRKKHPVCFCIATYFLLITCSLMTIALCYCWVYGD